MRLLSLSLALVLMPGSLLSAAHTPRPVAPQEVFAPFWSVQPGWHTELMIRNNTTQQLSVLPVLRRRTGSEVPLEPVVLAGNEAKMIPVAEVLGRVAPGVVSEADAFGSVVFRYQAVAAGNIYASVLLGRTGSPIEFHFDAARTIPDFTSGSYESIWWRPDKDLQETLILANLLERELRGNLRVFDAKGRSVKHPFVLAARETQQISLTELLNRDQIAGEYGGVSIEPQDHPGYLQAMHFTINEAAGLGALLKVFPRSELPETEFTTRAPMLALAYPDPALRLPADTVLVPEVFLFNATQRPIAATVLVDWHSASSWGRAPALSLTLAPGETHVLKLDEAAAQKLGIPKSTTWASVELSYSTGGGDDVVAMAASRSLDRKHLIQTPFTDGLSYLWKGSEWMADADHNALITAGNAGTMPAKLDFKLWYDGGAGVYELPLRTLQTGEAITVDVGRIITTQQPDRNGKTIPPSVTSGTYEFTDVSNIGGGRLYEGKQQVDKTYGHATYGCALCCYMDDAWITDFSGKVGNSGPLVAFGSVNCQGNYSYPDITSQVTNWASGNPSVATVTPAWVNAVGAGQTYSSGRVSKPSYFSWRQCPVAYFYPQGGISVSCAKPTNFRQTAGYDAGSGRLHFEYAWDSSSGHLSDLTGSGCTVNENVSYPGGNPFYWPSPPWASGASSPNPTILPVPPVPGADGALQDNHSSAAFRTPYQAASVTATQYYEYSCTCDHSSNVHLMGPISITRTVSQNPDSTWKYTIVKSGVSANINPLP